MKDFMKTTYKGLIPSIILGVILLFISSYSIMAQTVVKGAVYEQKSDNSRASYWC
jgi:predicted negative regulator of RcsB-dependent stress response